MLPGGYKGVTRVLLQVLLQERYNKGVTRVLQECNKSVKKVNFINVRVNQYYRLHLWEVYFLVF